MRTFENNPFFDRKDEIRFDKVYSEKDFQRDCWYMEQFTKKNLLTQEQIELIVYFWVGQLKPMDRKIKKVAKETLKYMAFLRKVAKEEKEKEKEAERDAEQIDKK